MPRYTITHPHDQHTDDLIVDGDDLELWFTDGWAVLSDRTGICLAIPRDRGATIQRIDEPDPPPRKE